MVKSISKEILLFVIYLFGAVLCLPFFFIFLWLTDSTVAISDLLTFTYIFSGLVILLLNIYFGRWLLLLLKSIQ